MKRESITAAGYLERATELRALADQITDAHNQSLLLNTAEEYERMAEKLTSRAKPPDTQT